MVAGRSVSMVGGRMVAGRSVSMVGGRMVAVPAVGRLVWMQEARRVVGRPVDRQRADRPATHRTPHRMTRSRPSRVHSADKTRDSSRRASPAPANVSLAPSGRERANANARPSRRRDVIVTPFGTGSSSGARKEYQRY
jgi:hypothetical protein